MFSPRSRQFS